MSPEADVLEMKTLFEQLAELLVPRGKDIACVKAIHAEFKHAGENGKPLFTWNRVHELLKGRARRVDGFEKDNAKQRLAAIAALRKEKADDALRASQQNYRLLETRLAALEALYQRIDPEHAGEFMAAYQSQARRQGDGFAGGGSGDGPRSREGAEDI